MYAISFDLEITEVNFHAEIKKELEAAGFKIAQGNIYLSREGANLATVYNAIDRLRKIQRFRDSVRDLRAFKVEDWTDFTEIVKTPAS